MQSRLAFILALLIVLGITVLPIHADETACPGFLPSRLVIGETAQVLPDRGNRLRESATTQSKILTLIPVGGTVRVLDGPTCDAAGIAWWQVDYQGIRGWTAEGQGDQYWLEPITPENVAQVAQVGHGTMTSKVVWLPDGTIAVGGEVGIWLFNGNDLSVPPRLLEGEGIVHYLAVTGDNKTLISFECTGIDKQNFCTKDTVHFWDIASFTQTKSIPMDGFIFGATTINADGSMVVSSMGQAELWSLQTGKMQGEFRGGRNYVDALDYSPSGLLAGGTNIGEIYVWDARGTVVAYNLVETGEGIKDLAFSPDGSFFFAASTNETVTMFDTASGKLLRTMENNAGVKDPNCVQNCREADGKTRAIDLIFSPDGKRLASANWAGTLTVWDVASGEQLQVVETGYHSPLFSVAFSPDGTRLVTNAINKDEPNNTIMVFGIGA